MKDRCYKQAQLKHQLFQMRNAKKRNPIWKLTYDQVEYIQKIGFPVVPRIYRIRTKAIFGVKNKPGILKEIHYSHVKDRKKYLYKTLSKKNMDLLEQHMVAFDEYKYEVLLDQYVKR